MSLLQTLVLLHLGATAALLLVLGVVIALQRVKAALSARRLTPTRAPEQQVVLELDPRTVSRRVSPEPGVAGAVRQSS